MPYFEKKKFHLPGAWLLLPVTLYAFVLFSEEFVRSLSDFEISVPRRVSHSGDFISHHLHHSVALSRTLQRSKRDTHSVGAEDELVHYRVSVENSDLHLTLEPNHRLLAPAFVFERRRGESKSASDVIIEDRPDRLCHLHGEVQGHPGSKVAVSACNGLVSIY